MILRIRDIKENDYLLSTFGFKSATVEEMLRRLRENYPNLMSAFCHFDGYAFPSGAFVEESIQNCIPLIQINNVNEMEYNLNNTQKFVYLPVHYRKEKGNYELKDKSVLVSLTGGSDKEKDISIFYDGAFPAMLNQRVCAFSLVDDCDDDLLYFFYGLTFSSVFKDQWIGNGGVQKNTGKKEKENLYLPYISDKNAIRYVSLLVRALIHKSRAIAELYQKASHMVEDEIRKNQEGENFQYGFPMIGDIISAERMDAKVYSYTAKEIEYQIYHYKNGYYKIPLDKIKGGNTPHKRMIAENSALKFFWVTPTIISDIGLINEKHTINCQKNNINKNCLLLVNRTSKGVDGKYVGMSYFYDKEALGKGQYNQGIYAIQDYDDEELLYLNAIFNSRIYRRYFGLHSMGSKMKEIKAKQIAEMPIPRFCPDEKRKLIKLYHNGEVAYNSSKCNLESFEAYDQQFNHTAGIYELDASIRSVREKLRTALDCIVRDLPVEIAF